MKKKTGKDVDKPVNNIHKEFESPFAARKVRLPARPGGVKKFESVEIKGKSITETVLEDRGDW